MLVQLQQQDCQWNVARAAPWTKRKCWKLQLPMDSPFVAWHCSQEVYRARNLIRKWYRFLSGPLDLLLPLPKRQMHRVVKCLSPLCGQVLSRGLLCLVNSSKDQEVLFGLQIRVAFMVFWSDHMGLWS